SSAEAKGVKPQSVLTKPVTSSTLLEAIGEALDKGFVTETRAHEKDDSMADTMASLKGTRILLVEDNDMNQELAMELLSQAGIEVVVANHGQEALDILAQDSRFDGVLMDCQMPVMDGYTATRAIRKNPALAALPIIAMTANAMAGDKEKVIEAGMCDHIAKPLNVGEMFNTIAKWIRPDSPAANEAAPTSETPAATVDVGQIDELLAHLHALLADNDSTASDALDELTELARGTPLAAKLKQVTNAVANYDFDIALEALEKP
ncbi:MAG: response regulator, partial [Betaproteobacteria bacterium]